MQLDGIQRSKLATKYIFFELLPVFLIGIVLFIFIIFMFQSFKLTEYVVVHNASFSTALKIFMYQSLSYLPVLMPIALLFSVLMIYTRLSGDSEIAALQAIGLSPSLLTIPSFILSIAVTLLSFQISAHVAPWGNRKLDILTHEVTANRPPVTIREGVFSEGFFDLVVYANEVNESTGELQRVFIFDERRASTPLTIVAQEGAVITEMEGLSRKAFLRLKQGNVHRSTFDTYTKIDFESYDINLFDRSNLSERRTDSSSLSLIELYSKMVKSSDTNETKLLNIEFQRRLTLPFACFVFGLLGTALGFTANRRTAKSGSLVICVFIAIFYWIIYAIFETVSKQGHIPVYLSAWIPNMLFLTYAIKRWLGLHRAV